jgi:hypothetical protein
MGRYSTVVSVTVIVKNNHKPVIGTISATAEIERDTYYVNDLIRFEAVGAYDPDGDKLTYYWDFGDDYEAKGRYVYHVYEEAGVYIVTLTIQDPYGMVNTTSIKLEIKSEKVEEVRLHTPYRLFVWLPILLLVLVLIIVAYLKLLRSRKIRGGATT